MSFEEYAVNLYSQPQSALRTINDLAKFRAFVGELRREWPMFCPDEVEMGRLFPPKRAGEEILVSETIEGLFQVLLNFRDTDGGSVGIRLRYALANPRSVYEPFCAFTAWMMEHYNLCCDIESDLAPEQQGISDTICEVNDLRSILVPSMEYNRWLWQGDAQTEEDAILRPGDAVARFMTPMYINNPQASSAL